MSFLKNMRQRSEPQIVIDPLRDCYDYAADSLPKFNWRLLRDDPATDMERARTIIEETYRGGEELLRGAIKFGSVTTATVKETVAFAFRKKSTASDIIVDSEPVFATLTHFSIIHVSKYTYDAQEHEEMTFSIFLPFLIDGMMRMASNNYGIKKCLSEKIFIRDKEEKLLNGVPVPAWTVLIHPLRGKPKFVSWFQETVQDVHGKMKETFLAPVVVATLLPSAKRLTGSDGHPTISHYLLAYHGLDNYTAQMGALPGDISFVQDEGIPKEEGFLYFDLPPAMNGTNQFLRVKETLLTLVNPVTNRKSTNKRLLGELIYTARQAGLNDFVDLNGTDTRGWIMLLGRLIRNEKGAKAYDFAKAHLHSIVGLIDRITLKEYHDSGLPQIRDMVDMMYYILFNFFGICLNESPGNLYNYKVDNCKMLFREAFAKQINMKIYSAPSTGELRRNAAKKLTYVPAFAITAPLRLDLEKAIIYLPDIYGDNQLIATFLQKTRTSGSGIHCLHTSHIYAESINALVGEDLLNTGLINPFLINDPVTGAIIRQPYCDDIDNIFSNKTN